MKRTLLLPIILGLTLTLTGCKPSDAESNIQQSETSETTSTVRTGSAISSIPETASKEVETIDTQSEPIVTDALDKAVTDDKKPLRTCKHCGKLFYAKDIRSEFCSARCRNQYNVYKSRAKH